MPCAKSVLDKPQREAAWLPYLTQPALWSRGGPGAASWVPLFCTNPEDHQVALLHRGPRGASSKSQPRLVGGSIRTMSPPPQARLPLQCPWLPRMVQMVKNLPVMQETQVRSLAREDPLANGMATHSTIRAWTNHGSKESDMAELLTLSRSKNQPHWD